MLAVLTHRLPGQHSNAIITLPQGLYLRWTASACTGPVYRHVHKVGMQAHNTVAICVYQKIVK